MSTRKTRKQYPKILGLGVSGGGSGGGKCNAAGGGDAVPALHFYSEGNGCGHVTSGTVKASTHTWCLVGNMGQSPVDELTEVELRVSRLESEQAELRRRLADVDTSLSQSRACLAELRNRSSRIYTLPPEILSYVFEHGARQAHYESDCASSEVHFPSLIAQVSRRWRAVARATPSIWAYIRAPQSFKHLALSKVHGLIIDLGYDYVGPLDSRHIALHMDMLIPHVDRWVEFRAQVDRATLMDKVVTPLFDLTAPLLEILELWILNYDEDRIYDGKYSVLMGGAPRLRVVTMGDTPSPDEWPPDSNITELQLRQYDRLGGGETFIYRSLASLPSLRRLSVVGCLYDPDLAGKHVILPNLKYLLIDQGTGVDSNETSTFFEAIVAPSLVSLVLKGLTWEERKSLLKSIHRVPNFPASYPALRSLSIIASEDPPATREYLAVDLIRVFPFITHLTFGDDLEDIIPILGQLHDEFLKDSLGRICSDLHTLAFLCSDVLRKEKPVYGEVAIFYCMVFKLLDARLAQAPARPIRRVRFDMVLRGLIPEATIVSLAERVTVEWFSTEWMDDNDVFAIFEP
ncbi:hypothetical protein PLICRDRAFT_25879 [Plicaturopsis crispa FD-325 SS-3]|nr:hypothetical protein PLICRDRAFT_25879 [Plicaturopsis crispa FD-325 SS-3]